jgi:dTDP-4-amino-4,6-dideoxygalactose transaminase
MSSSLGISILTLNRAGPAVFHYVPLHSCPYSQAIARAIGELKNSSCASERLACLPRWYGLEAALTEAIMNHLDATNKEAR